MRSEVPGAFARRQKKMVGWILLCMAGLFLGFHTLGFTEPALPAAGAEESAVEGSVVLKNLSLPPGLKMLTGLTGQPLDRQLKVQVLEDELPLVGEPVSFRILLAPDKAKGQELTISEAVTDEQGIACTELTLGDKAGKYVLGAFHRGGLKTDPVKIRIEARSGGWIAFLIFGLLGGLGIFLMGMDLAGDGLKEAAGDRMRGLLSVLTTNRFMGLTVGALVTAVLQSSSVTTVMLVGFVSASMMTVVQAIGVMMGAKIGTTITAQIIAFKVSKFSLAFVALGFILQMVGRKRAVKQAGTIVLGFGMIFFGMAVMGDAMKPLRSVPEFTELLLQLADQPLLAMFLAIGFTAIVQSSSATIGLIVALCASGLLSLEAALPLAWGAHIGTCATALLSSIGSSREGKQIAVAHLVYSLAGVAVAFPFLRYFVDAARWVTATMGSESVARELANGHTIFTVASALVFVPFIKHIEWAARKIVPAARTEPPFGPKYLDENALAVPVLALEQGRLEIQRMAGIVREMFDRSLQVLADPQEDVVASILAEEDKVDTLEKQIRPFLARVAQSRLDSAQSAREHAYIYTVQDLEGIGDVLSKEIVVAARKLAVKGLAFSPEGLVELQQYGNKILAKFDRVCEAVKNEDRALAEQTIQLGFKEQVLERKLREAHLERLHKERPETVETSALHLSVLNNLKVISMRLESIARTLLTEM